MTILSRILIAWIIICSSFIIYDMKVHAEEWSKTTWSKYENLIQIWFEPTFARSIVSECKNEAKDPVNCIKIGSFIAWAESSMWWKCHRYNCVGMNDGNVLYVDTMAGVKEWVEKYNKYWYNQITPNSFYRDDGIPPITRYCMWEKIDGVCKNGKKNAWNVYNSLNF